VKNGAHEVAEVARKAKTPLVATGAAAVGLAGAIAMSRNGKRHKSRVSLPKVSMPTPKVSLPKRKNVRSDAQKLAGAVADAAKQADAFGKRVSNVAGSVQKVGEAAGDAAKKS
jgi:hypothetical protein